MINPKRQYETSLQAMCRFYKEMQNELKNHGFFEATITTELTLNGECRTTIKAGKNFRFTMSEHYMDDARNGDPVIGVQARVEESSITHERSNADTEDQKDRRQNCPAILVFGCNARIRKAAH